MKITLATANKVLGNLRAKYLCNLVAGPTMPPAPSHVTASHPLLMRHAETHPLGGSMAARVHRAGRPRGTYRYNPSTQTLHVHYNAGGVRHPNPPAILQR